MREEFPDGTIYLNPKGFFEIPNYSQAIIAPPGRTLYISGQVAFDAQAQVIGGNDVGAQMDAVFANLRRVLEAAGAKAENILKVTHYFVDYDIKYLPDLLRNMSALFPANRMPTSTLLTVPRLGRDGLRYELTAEGVIPE
jgi:enamine deaminase RidA (YjgF/YER057c/UK114 family)